MTTETTEQKILRLVTEHWAELDRLHHEAVDNIETARQEGFEAGRRFERMEQVRLQAEFGDESDYTQE